MEWLCPICRRDTPANLQEYHHLIPKCKKGKSKILLCSDCADQLHQLFTIQELTKHYNTLEKLLAAEKVDKWAKWVYNKRFGICMATKKAR